MRDMENGKYNGEREMTGTNAMERDEIARKVMDENPDGMDIEIKGVRLRLERRASCSGKTIWYHAELTRGQYIAITGNDFPDNGMQWCSAIDIDMDMRIRLTRFSRRNEMATWKQKMSVGLDEAFVTIL